MIEIKAPIWFGGKPSIGVADYRIGQGKVQVEITYTRKDGTRSFPGHYEMDSQKLLRYPVQTVKGGVRLHVARLSEWEHFPYGKPKPVYKPIEEVKEVNKQEQLL